jgi:hypothetical protein
MLMLLLSVLLSPREGQMPEDPAAAEPKAGHVANRVHPGDPIQEITVAGFQELAGAAAFVAASFAPGLVSPIFNQKLRPGESVHFADQARPGDAAYLVFYFIDGQGRGTLLSLTRAHADLPLAIGSCGYQFLLGIDRSQVSGPEYPLR